MWWGVRKAVGSLVALRKESVDRNKVPPLCKTMPCGSLSVRRAWIEILVDIQKTPLNAVALRKESVDRNRDGMVVKRHYGVALRKESVDRNNSLESKQIDPSVALRKESVDRNSTLMLIH